MRVSVNCGEATVCDLFLYILGRPKSTSVKSKTKAPGFRDVMRGVCSALMYINCIRVTNAGLFQVQLLKEITIGTHKPGNKIRWRAQIPIEEQNLNKQTLLQLKVTNKATFITRFWTSTD